MKSDTNVKNNNNNDKSSGNNKIEENGVTNGEGIDTGLVIAVSITAPIPATVTTATIMTDTGCLGADAEVVRFVSRDAAMIVRMRGLPFQTTEQQIRDFFAPSSFDEDGGAAASATADSGIVEPGGILFVNRADGRPSGDAFVLFASETAGRHALSKHKHRIGSRYVELFRTTQAEVQQLFNRTLRSPQQHQHHLLQQHQQQALQQQQFGTMAPRRDCVRLRGLPYEAQVQQVVEFLGAHARNVVFQGVHMIYNNQGHPSGEAFIQMNSEQAAAVAAQTMHNKYMELGKKKRYIEVFQCSPEDMNILLNAPAFPTATAAAASHGSPTGHTIMPTTLSAPAGALPPNIIHMGIVPNNFMPFGASPQAPIFRATPMPGFAPLLTPHVASGQTTTCANQSQQQQPQPGTVVSSLPNSIVYNGGTATLINTTSSANGQSAVAAANFCFPTLTTTMPPPFGAPASTAPLPGMMAVDHFQQNGQFLQIPFFHVDATGSMTAMQTAALINLQQQQQLLGKAQFFPLATGTGLPTPLGQFQWNGNVAGTLAYPMQLVTGGNTTPTVNDGSTLKIDANNNNNGNTNSNGQLDMAAAAAGMGIPHKAPFTLIHT